MLISIIVPAFNEERLLPACLKAIDAARAKFTDLGWDSEVIVCNNNSTDRTGEVAEKLGARVVFEPVNRISTARNAGARAARGDWLVFVDADSEPPPGLFQAVARHIRCGKAIGGGALMRFPDKTPIGELSLILWNWCSRLWRLGAGAFLFVEAAAFQAIGGFDEALYASEEIRFSIKLGLLGRRSKRQFVIIHKPRQLTSSRKLRLYSWRELVPQIARMVVSLPLAVRTREACAFWYDGRREP
ncbi:MAG TPA: glycosyltransferase [Candidatus Ozemobacteraceae bacterium]|nr:glycosyltransferase [Candidatus Ozemobacteraceae bacterium]